MYFSPFQGKVSYVIARPLLPRFLRHPILGNEEGRREEEEEVKEKSEEGGEGGVLEDNRM